MIAPDGRDDARAAEAGVGAGPAPRRGAGARAGGRRGAGRGRDGQHLRYRPPHLRLGRVVAGPDRPAAHTRPRVRRHRGRNRVAGAERRRRRLRLRREPHHLRRVLPVPYRPRAHVRAHTDPRRRPRRRLRALRGRPRVGDLAQRPDEAAARDRHPPGAVRQRRLRHLGAGPRRAGRSRCWAAGRSGCSRSGSRVPPARRRWRRRTARRSGWVWRRGWARARPSTSTRRRTPPAGSSSRTRASASTSSSRCPARRGRSPTRSGSPATAAA